MHIAIAGNIGSGKTTLTKMLAQRYGWTPRFEPVDNNPYLDDRTIFEDARIFAPNLHDQGFMSDRDFQNYSDLFDLMMSLVKLPQLMIYIRSSIPTLVKHIEKRGRTFEKSIRIDYLTGLQERYENWIKNYKGELIIIDGDNISFEDTPEDFRKVTDMIDASLYGLFPMGKGNK